MRLRDVLGLDRARSQSNEEATEESVAQPASGATGEAAAIPGRVRRLLGRGVSRKRAEDRVQWQHGDSIATHLLHAVLVGALLSGPVAVCWVAVATSPGQAGPAAAVGESAQRQTRDAAVAAAAAQRLVLTWLTASAADKAAVQAQLVDLLPATMALPEKRPAAPAQMWVGEVDERAPGRFRVVVATTGGPLGSAYFAVPVQVDGDAAVALALPARTRPPAAADSDRYRLPALTAVSADDPAFQTAAGYVAAYLTGSAELDRWTGPDAHLAAVIPQACASVRVDNVQTVTTDEASTTRAAVIATATCLARGRPSTSQYGLVLQVRDGRWEVAAEDPALLLDPTSASSTAASSTAASSTAASSATTSTPR